MTKAHALMKNVTVADLFVERLANSDRARILS